MPRFWLGPYIYDGALEAYTAPGNGTGSLSFCTQEHDEGELRRDDHYGLGVFWTRDELGPDWLSLGDGDPREIKPDETTRASWAALTGHTPQGDTLADWMVSQLTLGADPARELSQAPLVPRRDGTLELVLSGVQIRQRRFRWGVDAHTNRLRDLLRRNLNEYRRHAATGQAIDPLTKQSDPHWHRRCAKAMLEKYGCQWSDLKPATWDAEETPLPHRTQISDDFTNTDGTAITSHSAAGFSWAHTGSKIEVRSNALQFEGTDTGSVQRLRAETDLSTDDHYAQAKVVSYQDGSIGQFGGCSRMTSGAFTGYGVGTYPATSPDTIAVVRASSETGVTIIASTPQNIAVNDVMRIVSDGSTHEVFQNGVSRASDTDTTYSGGTRIGCVLGRNSSSYSVSTDDFQGGDWPIPTAAGMPLSGLTLGGMPFKGRTLG